MTSSVGKEGEDQYGDGRWMLMVRVGVERLVSSTVFLISTRGLSARPETGSLRWSGSETISFRTYQVPGSGTRGQ